MRPFATIIILTALMVSSAVAQPVGKTDSIGRKQGYWKKYSGDTLKYEGTFKNDQPTGEFKYYFPDGKIKSIANYTDNGKVAKTVSFHPNGKKLAEGTFIDKKKDGQWKYYNTSEILIAEENYKNGLRDGVWKTWLETGRLDEELNYKDNLKNGEWKQYYPDSLVKVKGTYVNDELNGLIQYLYISGKIMISGTMKAGIQDGVWMYFTELGPTDKRITYRNGQISKEEIAVQANLVIQYIDIYTIAYIFSEKGKCSIRLKDGNDIPITKKLEEMEYVMNDSKFFRVNPEYIVAIWSIKNRTTFSREDGKLELYPKPSKDVIVASDKLQGFLHWAGLIKGEE
ncbi:MAG: LytTR family transcriptional regulator DNA-binding domain-containing protein [Bacteroidota bacterium]